ASVCIRSHQYWKSTMSSAVNFASRATSRSACASGSFRRVARTYSQNWSRVMASPLTFSIARLGGLWGSDLPIQARLRRPLLPVVRLPPEVQWVVVHHFLDVRLAVATPLHLLNQFRHRQRVRLTPVAGRVGHDAIGADHLDNVAGPGRGALRRRVK